MTKTKKVLTSVSATVFALGMTGCGSGYEESSSLPPEPFDDRCNEYEWDNEEGVYQCDDDSSSYYRHYYHGGSFFGNKSSLKKDSSYKNYRNSSTFQSNTTPNKGFGSGSSYSGG
ncbi:aminotransferase yhxA [Sutcliffiella horikoshii]|uniref:aminotransferase yhxA n=1 Tax=Sutcliffiella horikoshii TaxID=79883 RepID=UPI00384FBD05